MSNVGRNIVVVFVGLFSYNNDFLVAASMLLLYLDYFFFRILGSE